jgi:hypothetical protein
MENGTVNIIRELIHHITQLASIVAALVWFGWKGFIVVFLVNWAANTAKYDRQYYGR